MTVRCVSRRPTFRSLGQGLICLLAGALLIGTALPQRAQAAALPGPAHFFTGLVDDPDFEFPSSSVRSYWLTRAQQVGSISVRVSLIWSSVAPAKLPRGFQARNPNDPHYYWSMVDATVRAAAAHDQTVVLEVYKAPPWAEGRHRPRYVASGAWDPDPRAFGSFAHAVASRYSGHFPDPLHRGETLPRVRYFQAWNEPNLPASLMPQWTRGPHGAIDAASPSVYRPLLNDFYAAVKKVQPDSYILAAGTGPYGDPPGVDRMHPLVFLRGLFCLTSTLASRRCPDPPHFDALDHHPYSVRPTDHARVPGDVGAPDLGEILRVLHAAQRARHALPNGSKSLWITEVNYGTSPPDSMTWARQARYLSLAFYEFWAQGVSHVFWSEFTDPVDVLHFFPNGGLYRRNGIAKPAAAAFRFPFVAVHSGGRLSTLWGKAPTPGFVVIERRVGNGWRPLVQLRTTGGGIFYARRHLGPRLLLRAQAANVVSPVWATK